MLRSTSRHYSTIRKNILVRNRRYSQAIYGRAMPSTLPPTPTQTTILTAHDQRSKRRSKHHTTRIRRTAATSTTTGSISRHFRVTTTTTAAALCLAVLGGSQIGTTAFSITMATNKSSSTSSRTSPLSSSATGDDTTTTTRSSPPPPLTNLYTNFSHSWIKNLSPETPSNRLASEKSTRGDDGTSNNIRRPVKNGHFVPVKPRPLADPRLVLHSPAVAEMLGLEEGEVLSEEFVRYFSGDVGVLDGYGDDGSEGGGGGEGVMTWATPYALSIMGKRYTSNCPFGTGEGYGDGRAIYIGEVVLPSTTITASTNNSINRYELQLKGAGPTPFCRGADGRAVLRSSLREFLASEAMHTLGVSTTRALSLIVSNEGGDTSQRAWYSESNKKPEMPSVDDPRLERYGGLEARKRVIAQMSAQSKSDPDVMVKESNAITCRVARSFLRVGHVDLYARRVERGDDGETVDVGTLAFKELEEILWHACFVEYPDTCYEPFKAKDDLMGASKCLLDQSMEGIATMVAEWVRVGFAQGNFNGDNCLLAGRTMDYGPFGFMDEYHPLFAKWTGSGEHFGFMNQPNAGYANFAILVSSIMPVVEGFSDSMAEAKAYEKEVLTRAQGVFERKLMGVFRVKMGFHPEDGTYDSLWTELEAILAETRADWTLFWRQLSVIVKKYPVDGGEISTSYGEMLALLEGNDKTKPGSSAFYTPLEVESRAKLLQWIQAWREALVNSYGENGPSTVLSKKDTTPMPPQERMRLSNPKYVLREWMMVEAYSKASPSTVSSSTSIFKPTAKSTQSDESLIHGLFELIRNPYDEGTEEEDKKYYRRAPDAATMAGGTAFMS